jgi:hypothetical protein
MLTLAGLVVSTCWFTIEAGETLDGIGCHVVQLFHHVYTGRFLLWPLENASVTEAII